MTNRFQKTAIAASISFLLISCGGGGGSSDPAAPASFTSATVQGKAAKGIIIKGLVQADELNSDGTVKTANVGNAVTDSNGKYSLTLGRSYSGGPIEVSISSGADTVMVCDAPTAGCGAFATSLSTGEVDLNSDGDIDFGDRYKPSSLNMTAMLPKAANNATIDVQITPFTHMAAQRARNIAGGAGGSLDATTVEKANSAVSVMLKGVDILRTEPVDVTDPASISDADATAIPYAALSAAVAEMASIGSSGDIDIDAVLSDLSSDFNDGSIASGTLSNILEGAGIALAQTATTDGSGVLGAIADTVAAAAGGDITPEPNPNAGNSDLEKATAFITDLRTLGAVIDAETLSPSQSFETQIDMSRKVYDLVSNSHGDAISAATDAMKNMSEGTNISNDLSTHSVFGGSFTAGTITKTEDAAGYDIYTFSNASFTPDVDSSNVATLDMVLHMPRNNTEISGSETWGIQSLSAEDSYSRLSATQGLITVTLDEPYTPDFDAIDPPPPVINKVAVDMTVTLTELKTMSGNSLVDAADPVTFSGDLDFTLYTYLDSNTKEVVGQVPGAFNFDGLVSNTSGDQVDVGLSASIPGANVLTPSNTVIDIGASYASANDLNNDGVEDLNEHLVYWDWTGTTGFEYFENGYRFVATWNPDGSVTVTQNYSDGYSYTYPAYGPYTDIQDYMFNNHNPAEVYWGWDLYVDGQGNYSPEYSSSPVDYSVDGYIPFTMREPDVDYNLDGEPLSMGLQFTVQLSGLPEANVSITGSQTALDTGNAHLAISYGTRSLSFYSAFKPGTTNPLFNDLTGNMTITNSDGVVLVLDYDLEGTDTGDIISGSMKIDGVNVGTLSNTDYGIKVTYIDGTFEFL